MSTDNPIRLSEEDTWNMWVDSVDARRFWADVRTEHIDNAANGDVASWYVDFVLTETDEPVYRIDHERILSALRTIAESGDAVDLFDDEVVETVRAIVSAPDNGKATDEVCQLDVYGFNAIVQVASVGKVKL
ncbi:hypothetical protein ACWEVP_31810 [Amycolatopsis sp. NPDC003865]